MCWLLGKYVLQAPFVNIVPFVTMPLCWLLGECELKSSFANILAGITII